MVNWPAMSFILDGHTQPVTSVTLSPDGKHIVSGSGDQTIRVWDAETGEVVSQLFKGHTSFVTSIAFSPDGKRIVSGSDNQTIGSGMRRWAKSFLSRSKGTPALSPPSHSHLTGSTSSPALLIRQFGEVISKPFKGHTRHVISVAFLPDGKHVVSGSNDQTICVSEVEMDSVSGLSQQTMTESQHHGGVQNASSSGFSNESKWDSGWIVGSESELLFWVPPLARKGLWWSRTIAVMTHPVLKLDTCYFVHGPSWQQCNR